MEFLLVGAQFLEQIRKIFPEMNDSKRILVIGGAGLIGSHLCRSLVDRDYDVYCMDIRSCESSSILREMMTLHNFNYIRHNVVNQFGINVDEIYNLASPSTLRYDQAMAVETHKVNILGTLNCLESARINRSRVLLASSGDVYGAVRTQSMHEDQQFGSTHSALAESKRAAESFMQAYKDEYQVDGKIARIFNTYGSGADLSDQRVVTKMIVDALLGRNLTIYGSGEQLRSFCWVGDVIDALIRLMNLLPDVKIPTINIGSNHEITIRALAEKIIDLTGSRSKIIHQSARPDDPRHKTPDISRARKMLGWQPTTTLDEGLRRAIAYFENELTQMRSWVEMH